MKRPFFRWFLVLLLISLWACGGSLAFGAAGGTYPKIEARFELPSMKGNAFDFTQNDVIVSVKTPDNRELRLPAFFDGENTWRFRHTPDVAGTYSISAVFLNGARVEGVAMTPDHFDVTGVAGPGFVRVPANDKTRFEFDNGKPYYPLGYDLAWQRDGEPTIPEQLVLMGKGHANWSRIWMCSWDRKALDWFPQLADQPPPGTFSFAAIKTWDQIVDAAEMNRVYFQLTLQQHGQYSTHADNNWKINPWNKANGGWLNNAADFFTDPKAIALTKSKYRYIIARWGYSPSIMAWELFNEVESVDAFKSDLDSVARWHVEMAKFIREQDVYHHLITTSSMTTEPRLWPAMDYFQCHAYPPDLLLAIEDLDSQHLPRPFFYGEIGAATFDGDPNPGDTVHRTLWGSIMSQSAGAAQYWFWELIGPKHLMSHYTSAQKFIETSGMLNHRDLHPVSVAIDTAGRGPLNFGPAIGWAKSRTTHFVLNADGTNEGISGMSAFLQGHSHSRDMFPMATFEVNYQTAGSFAVQFDQITPSGARVQMSVDHAKVTVVDVANPNPIDSRPTRQPGQQRNVKIDTTIELPMTAGPHTIELENIGEEWIHIRGFTLTPYAPELAVLGKAGNDYALLWIYRRSPDEHNLVKGTITIPGLRPGAYTAIWWDTYQGKIIQTDQLHIDAGRPLVFTTIPVGKDVAVVIRDAKVPVGRDE